MTKEMMISEKFKLCEGYYSTNMKCQIIGKVPLTIYDPTKHVTLNPYWLLHRNQIPAALPTSAFSANAFLR